MDTSSEDDDVEPSQLLNRFNHESNGNQQVATGPQEQASHSRKRKILAAFSVVSAAAAGFNSLMATTSSAIAAIVAEESPKDRKPNGRYLRRGCLPKPEHSFWKKLLKDGDDMEWFHFISLSRSSFQDLVKVCGPIVNTIPLRSGCGKPTRAHIQ